MALPYPSWSVVFGSTPTAAFWSELGANDDALAAGTGFNTNVLNNNILHNSYKFNATWVGAISWASNSMQTLPFATVLYDTGSNYSASTFKFTAPITGFYRIDAQATVNNGSQAGYVNMQLVKNGGGAIGGSNMTVGTGTAYQTVRVGDEFQLTANDYVQVQLAAASTWGVTAQSGPAASFSASLMNKD